MPALRKPHRIAFLLPEVTIVGSEVALAHEVALLVWTACIETCQRHPGLAVYDAESTPLVPKDAHFAPQHALIGASPTDAFYATTRRDELVWLELTLPTSAVVRLHTLARDGTRQSFEVVAAKRGTEVGEQIHQVLGAWLSARDLGALPRRFDPVSAAEIVATARVIAPVLVEQARAWALPTAPAWSLVPDEDADDGGLVDEQPADDVAIEAPAAPPVRPTVARPIANRVPATGLKLAALRLLQLALREDLDDLILAIDPSQPQALFARYRAGSAQGKDFELLREVIAAAPCWARPNGELRAGADELAEGSVAPTELESVAGAGLAALCRPTHLDVIERVADLLDESGLVDEGVRLLERALVTHPDQSRAHIALCALVTETDREGASLAHALRSSRVHGCPMDAALPWYPDQIQIDLMLADALVRVGRLDEAIALRASRLEGREASWPRHARILGAWRTELGVVARSYAREGAFRGDPARAVDGFGRSEPEDDVDVAVFLDALVAMGCEHQVTSAWSQFGRIAAHPGPVARLAAGRALLAAGDWRRGLEELWRVELTEPGRDEHVAIARGGLLLSGAPLEIAERALGERIAIGASSLARRMARTIADFVPGAVTSPVIARALGKLTSIGFDPGSLGGFAPTTPSRRALDALFAGLGPLEAPDAVERGDRLVDRWLEVVFTESSEDEPAALAHAAAYAAAHALGRYLAATTAPASPLAGALRTVAGEALALVRRHRGALADREARALLGVLEPLLRRVDRWIGSSWLGCVERSCRIDERAGGDVAGFVRPHATIAARILGPEESAVLAASIARLHRDRPTNWAAAVVAQATQLALHTGYLGADEWADATVAQLAAREIDTDDALDALHTTSYLVEGISTRPAAHAARVLREAGRLATDAEAANAVPNRAAGFAATVERAHTQTDVTAPPSAATTAPREPVFAALEVGDFATASALISDPSWRVRRAALEASRFRSRAEHDVEVTPRARAAAATILDETVGVMDREARSARALALQIREQAYFARDRVPRLGDRMTPAAFARELRVRGGGGGGGDGGGELARGAVAPRPVTFEDRVIVPGGKLERISDYVALLRDLAALTPSEAIAQFDLDEAGYLEVARAWAAALEADPSVARAVEAGLAKR